MSSGERTPMSKKGLWVGIDTNILVYFLNEESVYHTRAKTFIDKLQKGEIQGMISWQNLSELYAIVTDPKRFPKPMTANQVVEATQQFLESGNINVIFPIVNIKEIFFSLVLKIKPKAQAVHDISLAATLLSNGVKTLVTENTGDFKGVEGLRAMGLEEAVGIRG